MSTTWEIGLDGFPVSPDHPANSDKRTVEDIIEARFAGDMLALERAWSDGSFPALSRAVQLCGVRSRPLPAWAEVGVQRVFAEHFDGRTSRGRGRSANVKAAHRDNAMHFERWSTVDYLRSHWRWISDPYAADSSTFTPMERRPTLEESYELASEALAHSKSKGTPDAVKKSYQRVERHIHSGNAGRYWVG